VGSTGVRSILTLGRHSLFSYHNRYQSREILDPCTHICNNQCDCLTARVRLLLPVLLQRLVSVIMLLRTVSLVLILMMLELLYNPSVGSGVGDF